MSQQKRSPNNSYVHCGSSACVADAGAGVAHGGVFDEELEVYCQRLRFNKIKYLQLFNHRMA
jgi:hypothetical protein